MKAPSTTSSDLDEGNDTQISPFHKGEQQVQSRLGVRDIEAWAKKVVRDYLPGQHREFHTALPFMVVAARDANDRPWATVLAGEDGFITSPDEYHLAINAKPVTGDALEDAFDSGTDVGILGIELATRRRNRVNGRIVENDAGEMKFRVSQSFGNCPQYIHERAWQRVDDKPSGKSARGAQLTQLQQDWITSADTFFIASGYRGDGENAAFGMDASHRGGERGFVHVLSKTRLQFPDYAGNNHYNTIGNLVLDPRVGVLFMDFETGSLLQITGTASIDWESAQLTDYPGARRLVTIDIEEVIEILGAIGLRWDADAGVVRSLRLVDKIIESRDVTSFIFEARDGGPLADFEPGQHLPIEVSIPGIDTPVRRTYSLSSGPLDKRYRITVKREDKGTVSRYLHDVLTPGAIVESRPPAGEFMMTCNVCPLVLVSAGVGVTPMMSILRAVAEEEGNRPVWFIHGARDGAHHPLADEVRQLVDGRSNIKVHVAYSQPDPQDKMGKSFDSEGRVHGALVAELVGNTDAHYFLCGPTSFMAGVQAELEGRNVLAEQIHTETFGPVG